MPKDAISSQQVDFILPAVDMPKKWTYGTTRNAESYRTFPRSSLTSPKIDGRAAEEIEQALLEVLAKLYQGLSMLNHPMQSIVDHFRSAGAQNAVPAEQCAKQAVTTFAS